MAGARAPLVVRQRRSGPRSGKRLTRSGKLRNGVARKPLNGFRKHHIKAVPATGTDNLLDTAGALCGLAHWKFVAERALDEGNVARSHGRLLGSRKLMFSKARRSQ